MSEIEATFQDLQERLASVPDQILIRWRGTPTPSWDNYSRFVYRASSYEEAVDLARAKARDKGLDEEGFVSYAVVRLFNYLTSRLVETMFLRHPGATAEPEGNKFRDLRLFGQPFDVKLTFPPKARKIPVIRQDLWDPRSLMQTYLQEQGWLRFSPEPRLLVVLADIDAGNNEMTRWRLKRQLPRIEALIGHYMALPSPRVFPKVTFKHKGSDYETTTDILFMVKDQGHYQHVVYRWTDQGFPGVVWHHDWATHAVASRDAADEPPVIQIA